MKIIDNVSKTYHLSELGQGKRQIKFAMIDSKTGETITPFCKCKDYFNDMFWGNATKKDVNVCGFHWKPNQDKGILDKNILAIAVKIYDSSSTKNETLKEEQITSIRVLLNKFEKKLKFRLTTATLDDDKKHIILKISKKWSDRPYLVSALFFLIRLGFTYDPKEDPIKFFSKAKSADYLSPYDESYFRTAKKKLEDLLDGKIDTKQTYEMYDSGSAAHGGSGIVGYTGYSI